MPNNILYGYLQGAQPLRKAESNYVAINHNGQTWHLFNAERMALGRMAAMIAVFIRGKHKPQYATNRFDLGDKCIVVNASKVKATEAKMTYKLYRHHTGYVGGLKEIPMKDLVQKHPDQVIRRAVKGMLPKNNIREEILDKFLFVHADAYHNHHSHKLPHFEKMLPHNVNELLSYRNMTKENT